MNNLCYKVYYHNVNKDSIDQINIFDFSCLVNFLEKESNLDHDFDEFNHNLRKELMYYFWSRTEYEMIVSNWCGKKAERKIDIFEQLDMNWDVFVDMCYKELLSMKAAKTTQKSRKRTKKSEVSKKNA